MKRKVIQIADSTQLISLPRKWAQKHNIRKGDELEVEEKGNSVLVSVNKESDSERTEVDIASLGSQAKKVIGALYKAGYDEIKINFLKTEELRYVQEVIKDTCVGFEIVEQGRNYVIARKISTTIAEEFEPILRRCFLLLLGVAKDGLEAVKKNDYEAMDNIILIDQSINKFTDFCRRILNRSGYSKLKRTPPFYYVLEELEKTGDEYKEIYKYLSSKKLPLNKHVLTVFAETNELLEIFYNMFYKFELQKIKTLHDKKVALDEETHKLIEKNRGAELEVLFKLRSIADRVYGMKGPLTTAIL
jgi:phosphate uptake regulator